ncbi:hypothetical protein BU15DRAFT_67755 [Melanogaster broomeanus]|nr:hypothetical protein BU15DRAFT_67755 [Melanogaster broomeanus]
MEEGFATLGLISRLLLGQDSGRFCPGTDCANGATGSHSESRSSSSKSSTYDFLQRPELGIVLCMTVYNEDEEFVRWPMHGVIKSIVHDAGVKTWGKDGWIRRNGCGLQ